MISLLSKARYVLSRLRYQIRKQPWVAAVVYMVPNVYYALSYRPKAKPQGSVSFQGHVAVCLRFRDEGRYLHEWIEYHLAAGIDHFFLYNNYSEDNYIEVLTPYVRSGLATLIEWPRTPASPAAENDAVDRARGRFEWMGFLDADEFVVIRDGRSVPEFLGQFPFAPGVALHWWMFGSNGHEHRPEEWVTRAYTRRAAVANNHFKVFVRPDEVTRNRNSHNFYYRGARCAVQEDGRRVYGSMSPFPRAEDAWINHYFCKSMDDYMEKAHRRSTLDKSGMIEPSRRQEWVQMTMRANNEASDERAVSYFEMRSRSLLKCRETGASR